MPEDFGLKDSDLKNEITERYKAAKEYYEDWEEEAREDYEFALGDQWDDTDRQKLKDEGRPCLTFNRIRPIINIISGYQRENSSRIKVNPEGQEDKNFSEFCDKLLTAIDKWSKLNYKLGYQFDDGLYCGKGWIEALIDYVQDPVRGELRFILNGPYQLFVDPASQEYDINIDAEYLIKIAKFSKDRLKSLYPEKRKLIDGFVEDNDDAVVNGMGEFDPKGDESDDYGSTQDKDSGGDKEDSESDLEKDTKFTLKEYWRKKYVDRYFVINIETGEPKKFDDKDQAEAFAAQQGAEDIKVIRRSVPEMWVAAQVCGHIIQDVRSPFEPNYSGFPFFRFIADWAPSASTEELRVQGVTRQLKDPQREKNKAKSQHLHILNTQANSGWVGDEDALSNEQKKKLEEMGAKPGVCVWKRAGKELREIQPKGPNAAHIQREQAADEEFKQISSVNPDLMGMTDSASASGRAMGIRIKQAVTALVRIFYNYRYTKEILGKFMLQVMPIVFDTKKAMKVVGPAWMQNAGLSEGHVVAWLTMIEDNKYDVIVTEAGQNSTLRYETFMQLTDLLKAGAPIPIELLIDYLDVPNAEEIKQKVMQQQQMQQQQAQAEAAAKAGGAPAGMAPAAPPMVA